MDYITLKDIINNGDFSSALDLLQEIPTDSWNEETAILAASAYYAAKDYAQMFTSIQKGLLFNHKSYELYLLLGNYYEHLNADQAYLCYENAQYYCTDPDDLKIILNFKEALIANFPLKVHPVSIILLTYNVKDLTIQCIESIRHTLLPDSYELICVDNASTDGIREWLISQNDIKLICNETNIGFPAGCNAGIKIAAPDNDILLLNNDTLLTPNAIFWLRMGLYESERTGAAGSVSNIDFDDQTFSENNYSLDEYMTYAIRHNIPAQNPYEIKIYLLGFALLIKRHAMDNIGLLDIRFSPGTFEDNDYGMRLQAAGFQCRLCHNSFIIHYGSGNGSNNNNWCRTGQRNNALFIEKYGFDLLHYIDPEPELIDMISHESNDIFSILEIGCGCGATLSKIKYLYPYADIHGIEASPLLASIGANNHDIICDNIENKRLDYAYEKFDYIILNNVLAHIHNPSEILAYLSRFLKPCGKFLCSFPNIMHISVIFPLLKGKFDYQESGILSRKHIRFYTLTSITAMFGSYNLTTAKCQYSSDTLLSKEDTDLLEKLQKISGIADKKQFLALQYFICAEKKH